MKFCDLVVAIILVLFIFVCTTSALAERKCFIEKVSQNIGEEVAIKIDSDDPIPPPPFPPPKPPQ